MKRLISAVLALFAILLAAAQPALAGPPTGSSPAVSFGSLSLAGLGYQNIGTTQQPFLAGALANTEAGLSDTTINVIGDSTMSGIRELAAGITDNYAGARALSLPVRLCGLMNASGRVKCRADAWFGDAAASTHASTVGAFNTNLTVGAGWAATDVIPGTGTNPGYLVVGGFPIGNTTTTNSLCYAMTVATTVDLYYFEGPDFGAMTDAIDGGAAAALPNTAGGDSIQKVTITLGAEGSHSICIARVSGNALFVGMDPYSTTTRMVRFRNLSFGGAQTSQFVASNGYFSPFTQIGPSAALKPNGGTVIDLGINDWANSVTTATFQANMQTLISRVLYNGTADVLLVQPNPSNTATISQATQNGFRSAIQGLAASNGNLGLIDLQFSGTWTQNVVAGLAVTSGGSYHLQNYQTQALLLEHALDPLF